MAAQKKQLVGYDHTHCKMCGPGQVTSVRGGGRCDLLERMHWK